MVHASTIPPGGRPPIDDDAFEPMTASPHPAQAAHAAHQTLAPHRTHMAWRMPGEARIVLTRGGSRVCGEIRNRRYDQLPDVAVIGPTSRAVRLSSEGAPPIEVPVSALEWSRFTAVAASTVVDRIVPAADLGITCLGGLHNLPAAELTAAAAARLAAATKVDRRDLPGQSLVPGVMTLIEGGTVFDANTAAERLDIPPHVLRRIALRWFGFPPKTLLMRRRFVAAMAAFRVSGMDFASVAAFGYFDASHFLRDAGRFLGTTPRRYLRLINGIA